MLRSIPLLAVALLACWGASGCTSCQGTYDYCGPLPDEPCDFFYRRNSILGGDLQTRNPEAAEQQTAPEQQESVPTPAPENGDGTSSAPAPEPMPPDADVPEEMDLPGESDAPSNSDAPPEGEAPAEGDLPPGASIHSYRDPYAHQQSQRPRGPIGSLFRRWR